MPKVKARQFETFDDGILSVCETEEEQRALLRTKLDGIRFGNRTVGVQRFWSAKTAGNKIDRLVSIPLAALSVEPVQALDIVILDQEVIQTEMKQYQVKQIQMKYDTVPPAAYLSLEKLVHPYKDRRNPNGD